MAASSHEASLARGRALTAGGGRELFGGRRSCCWEWRRICDAYLPFVAVGAAAGGGEGGAWVQLVCCALGVASTLVYLPFCAARRRERESFAVVVAEAKFAVTDDEFGWSCSDVPKSTKLSAADTGAILLVEEGCCCGDVRVFMKDPVTGARKRAKCCCCECNAGPDHVMSYVHDNTGLARALREAAVTGASKGYGSGGGAGAGQMPQPYQQQPGGYQLPNPAQYAIAMQVPPSQQQQQQQQQQQPMYPAGYSRS